jgi:hypothetical protein
MSNEDKSMMAKYGISCEPKMHYFYMQYRYDNINDALRYAVIDTNRIHDNSLLTPSET